MAMNNNDIGSEEFNTKSSPYYRVAERLRDSQNQRWIAMLLGSGLILGAIIWVLVGNDNDDSDSTNGTDAA